MRAVRRKWKPQVPLGTIVVCELDEEGAVIPVVHVAATHKVRMRSDGFRYAAALRVFTVDGLMPMAWPARCGADGLLFLYGPIFEAALMCECCMEGVSTNGREPRADERAAAKAGAGATEREG